MMNIAKTAAALLVIGLTGIIIWQQGQIRRLRAESTGLRERIEQDQHQGVEAPQQTVAQHSNEAPSTELLRLRGEVTVLRRQLTEAARLDSAPTGAPGQRQAESVIQPQTRSKPDLAALDAHLTAQEQKLESARQQVVGLVTALAVPQDVSKLDPATGVAREDLKQYWSYFEAKKVFEEEERYTKIMKIKVRLDHLDAGDAAGAVPSQ
jgi:hypothetical protein